MTGQLRRKYHWIFCVAALALWLAWGWPVVRAFLAGAEIRDTPVSVLWFVPFGIFGAAVLVAMALKLREGVFWALLCVEVVAVVAMTIIVPWAAMSTFLVIVAWQAAMETGPAKSLSWVAFQRWRSSPPSLRR
jgi:hypothetical protein